MKRMLILLIAALVVGYVQAQQIKESEVPLLVKEAFLQKFPKAKEVKWEHEDATAIEAEFKIGKSEYSAKFDLTGKWLETEMEIDKKELPEAVRATLSKEFAGFKIGETEKVEMPEHGVVYEIELEKKEITYAVQFSTTGKVLKKEIVNDTEEKD